MADSCVVLTSVAAFLAFNLVCDVVLGLDQTIVKTTVLFTVSVTTLFAFISAHIQLPAILGTRGLFPVSQTLGTIREFLSVKKTSDLAVHQRLMPLMLSVVHEKYYTKDDETKHVERIGLIDIALTILSIVYPHPVLFVYLYCSYYAIKRVGGRFFNFQWDALLLETLVLTTLLAMSFDHLTTKLTLWLFKILVFRLMFGSGIVKYYSGDASWSTDFTAMGYHFLTQPLPNVMGMHLYNALSPWAFKAMTLGTLVVEGIIPLLPFLGLTVLNRLTAVLYVALQVSIAGSGYYGFFNYLTMALSLCLLDDALFVSATHALITQLPLFARVAEIASVHGFYASIDRLRALTVLTLLGRALCAMLIYPAVALIFCSNVYALYLLVERTGCVTVPTDIYEDDDSDIVTAQPTPQRGKWGKNPWVLRWRRTTVKALTQLERLHEYLMSTLFVGCHYGLFANMTKIRNEIVIELSRDETHWHSLELPFKPGDPDLPPKVVTPFFHMPRVDWVFWFLAFRPVKELLPKWFWLLVVSVMEGDNPRVLELLHPTANSEAFDRAAEAAQERRDKASGATTPTAPGGTPGGGSAKEASASPLFLFVRVRLLNYTFTGRVLRERKEQHLVGGALPASASAVASADEPAVPDIVSGAEDGENGTEESDSASASSPDGPFATAARGPRRSSSATAAAAQRTDGRYWSVLPIRTILPSTSLAGVYAILDSFDERVQQRAAERSPPTVETAKDIIMRTLFAGLKKKSAK